MIKSVILACLIALTVNAQDENTASVEFIKNVLRHNKSVLSVRDVKLLNSMKLNNGWSKEIYSFQIKYLDDRIKNDFIVIATDGKLFAPSLMDKSGGDAFKDVPMDMSKVYKEDNLLFSSVKKGEKAKDRIVIFTDFQCPYCAESIGRLKSMIEQENIEIYFYNFPLENIHLNANNLSVWAITAMKKYPKNKVEIVQFLFRSDVFKRFETSEEISLEKLFLLLGEISDGKYLLTMEDVKLYDAINLLKEEKNLGLGAGVDRTPYMLKNGRTVN